MVTRRWRCLLIGLLVIVALGQWSSTSLALVTISEQKSSDAPITGLLQWQKDGVPLATALGNQRRPQIVTDDAGGAIVLWEDYRPYWGPDAPADLYAQRITAAGQPLWQLDGVPVAGPGDQFMPQLISDGAGGAIATWLDDRTGQWQIYAQRLSAAGVLLWGTDGVQLTRSACELGFPTIAGDQAEGAIITWADYGEREGAWPIVRVQRVRADGTLAWAETGITVTIAAHGQFSPQITSDGNGGAILAWAGDCGIWSGLCVQRLYGDGALVWGRSGHLLSVSNHPGYPQIQLWPDDAGGATVVWVDVRHLNADLYAQRVTADGVAAWPGGGVPVIVADGEQMLPRLVSDNQGGVIVGWHDRRQPVHNVFLQRLGASDGGQLWDPAGILVGTQRIETTLDSERHYDLIPDGAGGAMISWQEFTQVDSRWIDNIFLQHVSANGSLLWSGRGSTVNMSLYGYGSWYTLGSPRLLLRSIGDIIVVWEDDRRWYKTDEYDIYAQRVVEGACHLYLPLIHR